MIFLNTTWITNEVFDDKDIPDYFVGNFNPHSKNYVKFANGKKKTVNSEYIFLHAKPTQWLYAFLPCSSHTVTS